MCVVLLVLCKFSKERCNTYTYVWRHTYNKLDYIDDIQHTLVFAYTTKCNIPDSGGTIYPNVYTCYINVTMAMIYILIENHQEPLVGVVLTLVYIV